MKKLILAFALVIGLTTFAQEKRQGKGEREKLTPEQQVELQVKKMKLDLDLTDKQTAEIQKIVSKQVEKREAKRAEMEAKRASGEKPSKDEFFKKRNAMLDEQIAHKAEMKKILTSEQYTKWESKHSEQKKEFRKKAKGARKERKMEDNAK
ncbi:hypothetical protein [Flavobacterium sp.]|uniref:hypothetical protein n=1 Tax=Flavobacterium sp. TaxID=239 RepID=UPI002626D11C|nr:hypothetical protein [Flavobacterium sp.]